MKRMMGRKVSVMLGIPFALLVACILLPLSGAFGRPVTARIFADHAVLQCDKPVAVWGQASPGERVAVSFAGCTRAVIADDQGGWKVVFDPLPASAEPREMIIRGDAGDDLVLKDILVGEVWVASGQSNMEWALSGCANAQAEIAAASHPWIRAFKVSTTASLQRVDTVRGSWSVCSPSSAGGITGVGYFFARDILDKIKVPIGIIDSSWGATAAEAWTSLEALDKVPELKALAAKQMDQMRRAPEEQAAFLPSMAAWEEANGVVDKENAGFEAGWAEPDHDDSAWKTVETGFNLAGAARIKSGAAFWVRKVVTLPPESAGKPFSLYLGYLSEQYDTVYFNGEQVGSVGKSPPWFYSAPRGYSIPGKLVKPGRNLIAARFVAHTCNAGLHIPGSNMQLPVADAYSIDNKWRFKVERLFPELSPQTLGARPTINSMQMQQTATSLFNGMVHPLTSYGIRGVIWYQGESNTRSRRDAELYEVLFPLMIADWRERWGLGDFPFLFVQLANYSNPVRTQVDSPWAVLREAQTRTLRSVSNVGMAVAVDIGSEITIHPLNKQDVGKRLALWARAKVYGEKDLVCQSPLYCSHSVEGGAIRVRFDTGGSPLMVGKKDGLCPVQPVPGGKLEWFEIGGADGKFFWADAVISGDCVVVSSPDVSAPTSVRYAWAMNPQGCNLYNEAGLPASPFTTDGQAFPQTQSPQPR